MCGVGFKTNWRIARTVSSRQMAKQQVYQIMFLSSGWAGKMPHCTRVLWWQWSDVCSTAGIKKLGRGAILGLLNKRKVQWATLHTLRVHLPLMSTLFHNSSALKSYYMRDSASRLEESLGSSSNSLVCFHHCFISLWFLRWLQTSQ